MNCDLKISDAVIRGNTSAADGGGLYQSGGTLLLQTSQVTSNSASAAGGGLYVAGAGSVNMNDVTVSSNRVNLSSHQAGGDGVGCGGGLYISGGTLTTNKLSVASNEIRASGGQTIQGAGIYADGVTIDFNGGSGVTTAVVGNTLQGDGAGTGVGAGILLAFGALNGGSVLNISDNAIMGTTGGVGGAIAFLVDSSYATSYEVTTTGNEADAGGDVYAFFVPNTSDSNDNTSEVGPAGIAYFTGGTGSLRSAINYCQNEMTSEGTNVSSMAIMLASSEYSLSSTDGQLVGDVGGGEELTIIAEGPQATIDAGQKFRDLYVEGSGTLVLQGLVITGGYDESEGGGIFIQSGILTLNHDNIAGNEAGVAGTAAENFTKSAEQNYYVSHIQYTAHGHAIIPSGIPGADGASGYGGGIYLGGGTLDLLSDTTITGNTVQGQNGAPGQNGLTSPYVYPNDPTFDNGEGGGPGGAGGDAVGGGLYQAGGILNSPVAQARSWGIRRSPARAARGVPAAPPRSMRASPTVHPANPGRPAPGGEFPQLLACGRGDRIHVECDLRGHGRQRRPVFHRRDARHPHPRRGRRRVKSPARCYGPTLRGRWHPHRHHIHQQRRGLSIPHRLLRDGLHPGLRGLDLRGGAPGGADPGDITSTIDPVTLRSGVVQFLSGTAVGSGLDVVLEPVATSFHDGARVVAVQRSHGGPTLWRQAIMPKDYRGGFVVARFDFNFDTTPDYLLVTKTGCARVFFVDGRTGAVTRIKGKAASGLRRGMVVQAANLDGDGADEFILSPSRGRAGRISAINLETRRVSWTSRQAVYGGMTVGLVGSQVPGRAAAADVRLNGRTYRRLWKVLDGQDGRVVIVHKPPQETAQHGGETDERRQPEVSVPPAPIALRHDDRAILAGAGVRALTGPLIGDDPESSDHEPSRLFLRVAPSAPGHSTGPRARPLGSTPVPRNMPKPCRARR